MRLHFVLVMSFVSLFFMADTIAQTSTGDRSSADRNVSIRRPTGARKIDLWTKAKMEQAKAAPLPSVNPDSVRSKFKQRALAPRVPGATRAENAASSKKYSGNVYSDPLAWAGVLYFNEFGEGYRCSAQFISPHVILTAAHCVRDDKSGTWWSDFVFDLQYDRGSHSERYGWECVATKQGWVQDGPEKYLYDFAMIRVDHASITGHFGTRWNWQEIDALTKIGYPDGILDGEVIQVERGPISVDGGLVALNHGNLASQHGSSGGGWISNFTSDVDDTDADQIVSVESFNFVGQGGTDYGPYFDDKFKELSDYVERGCE